MPRIAPVPPPVFSAPMRPCREPEETRDGENDADDFAAAESALPAPLGAIESWADAPTDNTVAAPEFEAGGFEAVGE